MAMTASNRAAPPKISQRRQARLHAREQQRQRVKRRRYTRLALWIGIGAVAVAAVALLMVRNVQSQPGQARPIQGQQHIDKGQTHIAYNSKPPTSGPHWNIAGEGPVAWGKYAEPIPDEGQIHNLEHGGIMIQYNCRDCPELVAQLEDFYDRYTAANKLPLYPSSTKIVVAPYYDMPNRIALTAWGRIDSFNEYDEERITRFVQAFRDGPGAPERGVP
jgi:hypothetical protein